MSSGLTRGSRRPVAPHPHASTQVSVQESAQSSATANGSELWRSAPAMASTPVESRALTYEERRDRWRRQAGTLRWSTSDALVDRLEPDGAPSTETWRGLHP